MTGYFISDCPRLNSTKNYSQNEVHNCSEASNKRQLSNELINEHYYLNQVAIKQSKIKKNKIL